jgi:dUTP pyrophosphatase
MEVKFKKLIKEAVTPSFGKEGDAGMDLTAITVDRKSSDYIEYNTYIAVEIPEGHVGLLFPRSSVSKTSLILANSVGVVDSNYRGPIKFRFKNTSMTKGHEGTYSEGDRVGQLVIMPIPVITLKEVGELTESSRGDKGFGSSGK